jgi:hypothetical protein
MTTAIAQVKSEMAAIGKCQRDTLDAIRQAEADGDDFSKALAVGAGITELRKALTPATVAAISQLAGSPIGFRTDKDKPAGGTGYSSDTVRDCVIVALLRGLALCGNEFNIISGQCYITREGWAAMLKAVPGLCDLECAVGLPEVSPHNGQVLLVDAEASAVVDGRKISVAANRIGNFDNRLAVTAYKADIDQARGKAKGRILRMLYERITGSEIGQPEDGVEVRVVEPDKPAAIEDDGFGKWRLELLHASDDAKALGAAIKKATENKDVGRLAELAAKADEHKKAKTLNQQDYDRVKRFLGWADDKVRG